MQPYRSTFPLEAADVQEIQQYAEVFSFTPDVIEDLRKQGFATDQYIASAAYTIGLFIFTALAALPAMAVFVWLPLFAAGILVARLLTPLSWVVTKTQWALDKGNRHPLRAVGCIAAVVVFLAAAGWQTNSSDRRASALSIRLAVRRRSGLKS